MPLRLTTEIIDECREETGETDFSGTNGVPQSIPLAAFRESLVFIQNEIFLVAPSHFESSVDMDVTVGESEYDLPDNAFLGAAIAFVLYSPTGEEEDFYPLELKDPKYFWGGSGRPCRYHQINSAILIDPLPADATGVLRIYVGLHLDKPAERVGKVVAALDDATDYTTIELANDDTLDSDAIDAGEDLCVNDRYGQIKYRNVPYDSYDSTTRIITLADGVALSGGSIEAGDYITLGLDTTTHVKLDAVAEPIVKAYIRRRFYLGKSSDDVDAENENITAFMGQMIKSYIKRNRGPKKMPYVGKYDQI